MSDEVNKIRERHDRAEELRLSGDVAHWSVGTFAHHDRASLLQSLTATEARAEAAEARVGELEYMRPEVLAFARRMEDALRRKDGERGGNSWQKHTLPEEVLPHLQERAYRIGGYLKQARKYRIRSDEMMEQMETENAALEAVHAANFAMMIADICYPRTLKGTPDGR